jgi:hypothetical protein
VVHLKKHQSCGYTGTLIAIYKWVVPDDMKEVSSSHLKKIAMKVLAARSSLRHGERGLEEIEIPDALGAAISSYLVVVNLQDLFETEENW